MEDCEEEVDHWPVIKQIATEYFAKAEIVPLNNYDSKTSLSPIIDEIANVCELSVYCAIREASENKKLKEMRKTDFLDSKTWHLEKMRLVEVAISENHILPRFFHLYSKVFTSFSQTTKTNIECHFNEALKDKFKVRGLRLPWDKKVDENFFTALFNYSHTQIWESQS